MSKEVKIEYVFDDRELSDTFAHAEVNHQLPHGWSDSEVTPEYEKGRAQADLPITHDDIYYVLVEYTVSQQMSDYFRGRREAAHKGH